jgi:hypothetical protein
MLFSYSIHSKLNPLSTPKTTVAIAVIPPNLSLYTAIYSEDDLILPQFVALPFPKRVARPNKWQLQQRISMASPIFP